MKITNKYDLYLNAYMRELKSYAKAEQDGSERDINLSICKLITYGVKVVNSKPKAAYIIKEEVERHFNFIDITKNLMSSLTPKEFMNLFPIAKEYKGHKYETKDYFYTRNYLNTLDMDNPIGEKIMRFLWDYHNWEVTIFTVEMMSVVSDMRRLQGQPSLMEEFAEKHGLKTYTLNTDEKGRQFLRDNQTGKINKVSKKRPRYLRVIKKGEKDN